MTSSTTLDGSPCSMSLTQLSAMHPVEFSSAAAMTARTRAMLGCAASHICVPRVRHCSRVSRASTSARSRAVRWERCSAAAWTSPVASIHDKPSGSDTRALHSASSTAPSLLVHNPTTQPNWGIDTAASCSLHRTRSAHASITSSLGFAARTPRSCSLAGLKTRRVTPPGSQDFSVRATPRSDRLFLSTPWPQSLCRSSRCSRSPLTVRNAHRLTNFR
mmetsp:Transcript_57034/g.122445  ORF Transcript_57034/g.122445 Transcript_57034/m.122445 type:complete len:218 (-) Transcript_57034:1657-2310(-)